MLTTMLFSDLKGDKRMHKNIFMLFLVMAIFLLYAAPKLSAVGPGEEPKGGMVIHSIEVAHDTLDSNDDSLVTKMSGITSSWWRMLFPCYNTYTVSAYVDNGDNIISASDKLKLDLHWKLHKSGDPTQGWDHYVPPDTNWYCVDMVTITLKLARQSNPAETCFVECLMPPSNYINILSHPYNRTWERYWPPFTGTTTINVMDSATTDSGHGTSTTFLHSGNYVHYASDDWWLVKDVAIDLVISSSCPTPSITEWGLAILVILIITSAVFIMLKKRRNAAVPV